MDSVPLRLPINDNIGRIISKRAPYVVNGIYRFMNTLMIITISQTILHVFVIAYEWD